MILAQYVILRGFLNRQIGEPERSRIVRHFECTRRSDGGWGLHAESPSYVFITTLAYVALRLLGQPADSPLAADARHWLHGQPNGVLAIPSWGKFWLAMAGLYDYRGINPCPPELFLLPSRFPVNPDQLYCHTRYIYLGICFLYGMRFRGNLGPISDELRRELYAEPYETIDFAAYRNSIAATDLYVAPSRTLRAAWGVMGLYERIVQRVPALRAVRQRALARCLVRIRHEQEDSRFQGLSPVNGILNTIALLANDPEDPMIVSSLAGVETWRWDDAEHGIRFAGARSTSWDTSFAILAMLAGTVEKRPAIERALAFLWEAQQMGELETGREEGRDPIHGGWCFSDGTHRWPVSDCAAEAVSALLAAEDLDQSNTASPVALDRLDAAIQFILRRQNGDGGFGSYERRRGPAVLQRLNPSEMFGDCMTELSYIECTASAVIALCSHGRQHPERRTEQIDAAIVAGCAFLRRCQRADGSWPGFWGINFTYGTWLAVTALRSGGVDRLDPDLLRAAEWLSDRQKADGGWGEHYSSCLDARYVEHPESQTVMTSWALLALLEIVGPKAQSVRRGIDWLRRKQRSDGSWPDGTVNGAFFGSAMLHYRLYPVYFPLWALNRYRTLDADGGAHD
jgi:lanosterol synthase